MRILVADDHEIFRRGLRSILETHERWEVCAEAENGLEAVRLVERLRPNVVILDLNMPVMDGLEALEKIHERFPELPVVVVTMELSATTASQSRQKGATAFVPKSEAVKTLTEVIEAVERDFVTTAAVPRAP
ncbi:MAG: response regulator [Vicinamibacteria bacterium]